MLRSILELFGVVGIEGLQLNYGSCFEMIS
jgi:hypothetical protein